METLRSNMVVGSVVRVLMAGTLALIAFAGPAAKTVSAAGAVSLSDFSAYTQDFNSLANTGAGNTALPLGWYFIETGGDTAYTADDGTASLGDTYSYGSAAGIDRALGSLQTAGFSSIYGVSFTNNSGSAISILDISYFGEQWRLGSTARLDRLDFQYSTNAASLTTGVWTDFDDLDFTSAVTAGLIGARDGNNPLNRRLLQGTLSNLNIPNGGTFWFRWVDYDASFDDDGLAVDDFSLTPSVCANTVTVTNNASSGPGSLDRAAIEVCDGGMIDFAGDYTISFNRTIDRSLTIDASGHTVVLDVATVNIPDSASVVTLKNLTFDGRYQDACAISNAGVLALDGCTITRYNNLSYTSHGAAIYNAGLLTVIRSELSNNTADYGGALFNAGTATLDQIVFKDNLAREMGGAIYNATGRLLIQRSTISGNRARLEGGAIYNALYLTVLNSTVVDNALTLNPSYGGAGIFNVGFSYLKNSIVANNFISLPSHPYDIYQEVSDQVIVDHCLIESGNVAGTIMADPLLAPLADYGGGTQTYALLPGSPALDAGNSATCLSADQRDVSVPQGTACDLGAFESQGFILSASGGDEQSAFTGSAFTDPLQVTVTANDSSEPVSGGKITFTAPASGAGALLAGNPAVIAGGAAEVTATANGTVGAYLVSAGATGVESSVDFSLENLDPRALSIDDVTHMEGNSGTTTFTFTVSLPTPASSGGVTFDIATADGTATSADSDYQSKSLTAQVIPEGSNSYTFDVVVNGDAAPEPDETFYVNITNVTGANLADGQGLGTITNDDWTSIVATSAATDITSTTAAVNGSVNAMGGSTAVRFEYGLTTAYGSSIVAAESPLTGSLLVPVHADLSNLIPDTTYHYRAVGMNSYGTTYGQDQTFLTLNSLVTATIHDAAHATLISAAIGDTLHASAQVTGTGASPVGTITFTSYGNPSCSGTGITAGTIALDGSGIADPSLGSILTVNGLSFKAHYNGDANYTAGEAACVSISSSQFPTVLELSANTVPVDGVQLTGSLSDISVQFNLDVLHGDSSDPNSADNTANYLLVSRGANEVFDTTACGPLQVGGLQPDDLEIPVNSVSYDPSTYIAHLSINNGAALPAGTYRLFVCGTTSISDPTGTVFLNNRVADSTVTFTIVPTNNGNTARQLPATGFAPGRQSVLPPRPVGKAYQDAGIVLDVPTLGLQSSIVGVPGPDWDVTWLGGNVGYLQGTAFPTWNGNSVLTGHVTDAEGNPGPFSRLDSLVWGDRMLVHAWGQDYIYEVRSVDLFVSPDAGNVLTRHEEQSWLTLITCRGYDPQQDTYRWRTVVRAVLVKVE